MTRSCNKRRAAYSSLLGVASAGVSMLASCAIASSAVSPDMACHTSAARTAHTHTHARTHTSAMKNMQTTYNDDDNDNDDGQQCNGANDGERKPSTTTRSKTEATTAAAAHRACDYNSGYSEDDEIITTTTYDDLFDYHGNKHHNSISNNTNINNDDDDDDDFIMKTQHSSSSSSNSFSTNTNDCIKIITSDSSSNNHNNSREENSNTNKQDGTALLLDNNTKQQQQQQQQKSPFRRALFGGRQHRLFSDYTNELAVHAANDAAYDLIPESGFKIVVLGASKVGKTSIIQRFLYQRFDVKHKPTVEDNFFVEFPYNKYTININIIDTSGTYQFPAMRRLAINSGDAFILVYAVDDPDSFDELRRIRDAILDERHRAVEESVAPSANNNGQPQPQQQHQHQPHQPVTTPSSVSSCSTGSSASARPVPTTSSRLSLDASLVTCPACVRAGKLTTATIPTNQSQSQLQMQHPPPPPPPLTLPPLPQSQTPEEDENCVVTSLEHGFSVCPQGHLISNARLSLPLATCAELVASTQPGNHHQTAGNNNITRHHHHQQQQQHRMSCTSSSSIVNHHRDQAPPVNSNCTNSNSSSSNNNNSSNNNDNTSRRSSTVTAAEAALRTRRTLRPPMVVVANKCDLPVDEHRVNRDTIEPMVALDWGNGFVAASAARDIDINDIFQQVLRQAKQPPALADAIVSKRRRSLPPVLPAPSTHHTAHSSNYNLHSNTHDQCLHAQNSSNSASRRRRHLSDANEVAEMVVTRHRPASRSGATVGGLTEHRTACHVGLMKHLLRGMKLFSKHNNNSNNPNATTSVTIN